MHCVCIAETADLDRSLDRGQELSRPRIGPDRPIPKDLQEALGSDLEPPFGNHPGGELRGRTLPPLEAAHPSARKPTVPPFLAPNGHRQLLEAGHVSELNEDATE